MLENNNINTTPGWLSCSLTQARLSSVDAIIDTTIDVSDNKFRELALHTVKMGGKKLRPSLYLLSLNTGDYYDPGLLHPAAALELIHIGSLNHDDVMDRAELRRNAISVNAHWGNLSATYSGNYLFAKAISVLSNYNSKVNEITCHYISDLCLGQLKEAENAYNIQLTTKEYIDIIIKKTASLFELPCIIGAMLSGSSDNTTEALVNYAKNIGIAFQMIDDLLDLKGDSDKTGKKLGTDLREGVYTYATLHALGSHDSSAQLSELLLMEDMDDSSLQAAIDLINSSGGLEIARNNALEYIEAAVKCLDDIPDSITKQSLFNLAEFIISRDH